MTTLPSHKLAHLPLRPSTLATLEKRGFVSTGELEESKANGGMSNLAAELGCSLVEAAFLMREVESAVQSVSPSQQSSHKQSLHTALSLISKLNTTNKTIVTFSRSVDSLLGGGLAKNEVTEVAGLPGTGKTQLAMQLCVDASLPSSFGGVQGEAIYIDSEGSFSPERCWTMAKALVEHIHGTAKRRSKSTVIPESFTPQEILRGIHVFRVHDEASQTATIYSLPEFLQKRAEMGRPVRLVVVDSIAFHYRVSKVNCLLQSLLACVIVKVIRIAFFSLIPIPTTHYTQCAPPGSDYMARTRSLTNVAAFLADIATKFDVAVVAINQMTTKVSGDNNDISKLVPALGESWGHATTTRLLLSQVAGGADPSIRRCTLVKSPHKAQGSALYQVRETGIRDPPPTTGNPTGTTSSHSAKRPRVN